MAIEHDHRHSQTGYQRAEGLKTSDAFRMTIEECEQKHGEQRAGADDKRRVRCCRIKHGCILRQKIERTACNTKGHHQEFVLQRMAKPLMMTRQRDSQQQDVGNDETKRENLCWRETIQEQHLRKDKGTAPNSHYQESDKVI